LIKIRTNEGSCKKDTQLVKKQEPITTSKPTKQQPKKSPKKCKNYIPYDRTVEKNLYEGGYAAGMGGVDLVGFQRYCMTKGLYEAHYTDGTKQKCSKADGIWGCCSSHCFRYSPIPKG